MSSSSFDDIRERHPDLAVNLYAMEPGGSVTLEIITPDGKTFSFAGPTARYAIDMAFPPEPEAVEPEPAPDIFD